MKNIFRLPALLVISICALTIGCKKDNCSNTINDVQPNTNPVGYEVVIRTTGFTPAAKVVFGSVEAASRAGGEGGDIIARVPAGLSGNVEISVEEGDCIKRSGNFVVGGLPSGVQPSLQDIIIPTTQITTPTGIGNRWINAATSRNADGEEEQYFQLNEGSSSGNTIIIDPSSREFDKLVSNPVSGSANLTTRLVQILIDRTGNGGSNEYLEGHFVEVPDSAPAGATAAILLVSRETGRQLLLYRL